MGGGEPTGSARSTGNTETQPRRSTLADIADQTVLGTTHAPKPAAEPVPATQPPPAADAFTAATPTAPDAVGPRLSPEQAAELKAHRRGFRVWLGEFRRRRVLVPYSEDGAAVTVELYGARWLLVFTDEAALARYARARGEPDRTWRYRLVWGAAVLDAGVPAVAEAAGLPCGVLVDAGDGERGVVLPPVVGIVPEAVAVNRPDSDTGTGTGGVVDRGSGSGRRTGEGRS